MKFLESYSKIKQGGFSLVETMISAMLIGVVAVGVIQVTSNINNQKEVNITRAALNKYISDIREVYNGNIGLYKVNFKPEKFIETEDFETLNTTLPYGWDDKKIIEAQDCVRCKGRLGFTIYPHSSAYRGLYILKVRVIHPDLFGDSYQDYHLLLKGN